MLDGEDTDPGITHAWLTGWINILNGWMTPGEPGYKGYTSQYKLKAHWDNYARKRNRQHADRRAGKSDLTYREIEDEYASSCQFSIINDTIDKNFTIRAIVTKHLRRNGVQVVWHSNSPQTWSSELRYCANGLAQINPEIMKLEQWSKFRKDFELESFMTQEPLLYMHLLEETTMFHTTVRARGGQGATFKVSKTIYNPPNTTDEQKNFVDGMYKQCDLVCSDIEVIAIQNNVKLPMNDKLVYFEGDDHLKSQMAASGQVLPNYFKDRKKYTIFCQPDTDNAEVGFQTEKTKFSDIHDADELKWYFSWL